MANCPRTARILNSQIFFADKKQYKSGQFFFRISKVAMLSSYTNKSRSVCRMRYLIDAAQTNKKTRTTSHTHPSDWAKCTPHPCPFMAMLRI